MLFCSNLGISEVSREAGYECIFSGLPSENPCQKATVGLRNLHFHQVPTPEMILKQVVHRLCSGKHPPLPYPIWLIQVWKLRSPGGSEIVPKPLGNSLAQPDWTRTCALWAWAGSTLLLRAVLCGLNFLPFMYVSQPQVLPSLSWLLPPESYVHSGPWTCWLFPLHCMLSNTFMLLLKCHHLSNNVLKAPFPISTLSSCFIFLHSTYYHQTL